MVYLKSVENVITLGKLIGLLLPACASEQGNVIGSVRLYIYSIYTDTNLITLPCSLARADNLDM